MLWNEPPSPGNEMILTSGKAGSSSLEKNKAWHSSQPAHIWVKGTQMRIFLRMDEQTHAYLRFWKNGGTQQSRLQWNTLNCTWTVILTTNIPFWSIKQLQIILSASACRTEEQMTPDVSLQLEPGGDLRRWAKCCWCLQGEKLEWKKKIPTRLCSWWLYRWWCSSAWWAWGGWGRVSQPGDVRVSSWPWSPRRLCSTSLCPDAVCVCVFSVGSPPPFPPSSHPQWPAAAPGKSNRVKMTCTNCSQIARNYGIAVNKCSFHKPPLLVQRQRNRKWLDSSEYFHCQNPALEQNWNCLSSALPTGLNFFFI